MRRVRMAVHRLPGHRRRVGGRANGFVVSRGVVVGVTVEVSRVGRVRDGRGMGAEPWVTIPPGETRVRAIGPVSVGGGSGRDGAGNPNEVSTGEMPGCAPPG